MSSLLAAFLISLAVSITVMWLHRRRLRRRVEIDAVLASLREGIETLIIELNGATDRNVALLEGRIRALKDLSDRAENLVERLKGEIERSAEKEKNVTARRSTKPHENVPSAVDQARLERDSLPFSPERKEDILQADMRPRDKVLLLHGQGEAVDNIAARLGLSRGEVELIISLHKKLS